MWSKVNSSPNSFANLVMSSFVTVASPERTFFMKSYSLSALSRVTPLRLCFNPLAMTLTVSCRNRATSSFAFSRFLSSSSCFSSSRNVVGSIPGNSLIATGRKTSMKGIRTNAANGTRRKTSAVVRVICRRSRRVKGWPRRVLNNNRVAIFISTHNSLVPAQ